MLFLIQVFVKIFYAEITMILLVEDSTDSQVLIEKAISHLSSLKIAGDLQSARQALENNKFDLILLDMFLPDGNGMDFYKEIQGISKYKKIPVVFLTAKDEVDAKVQAFHMGAEDYITKPFNSKELAARIEMRLKKLNQLASDQGNIEHGPLLIDMKKQTVLSNEDGAQKELSLTPTEFKLLILFIENQGQIISRDDVIKKIWPDAVHIVERNVDTHISSLRKKVKTAQKNLRSIRNVGYTYKA